MVDAQGGGLLSRVVVALSGEARSVLVIPRYRHDFEEERCESFQEVFFWM